MNQNCSQYRTLSRLSRTVLNICHKMMHIFSFPIRRLPSEAGGNISSSLDKSQHSKRSRTEYNEEGSFVMKNFFRFHCTLQNSNELHSNKNDVQRKEVWKEFFEMYQKKVLKTNQLHPDFSPEVNVEDSHFSTSFSPFFGSFLDLLPSFGSDFRLFSPSLSSNGTRVLLLDPCCLRSSALSSSPSGSLPRSAPSPWVVEDGSEDGRPFLGTRSVKSLQLPMAFSSSSMAILDSVTPALIREDIVSISLAFLPGTDCCWIVARGHESTRQLCLRPVPIAALFTSDWRPETLVPGASDTDFLGTDDDWIALVEILSQTEQEQSKRNG